MDGDWIFTVLIGAIILVAAVVVHGFVKAYRVQRK
jgi:hypothetical protein